MAPRGPASRSNRGSGDAAMGVHADRRGAQMRRGFLLVLDLLDTHAHVRLFVDGALSGSLVFRPYEYEAFKQVLEAGCQASGDGFEVKE